MKARKLEASALKIYAILVLLFVFFPGIYLTVASFNPTGTPVPSWEFSLKWYSLILEQARMHGALQMTVIVSLLTVIVVLPLALLAARAYENTRLKSLFFSIMILPIIIPGAVLGIGLAFFLRFLGFESSIWTILIAHVLWVLPFALIVLLVTLSGFRRSLREASYTLGASGWRTFREVEVPLVKAGIISVIVFSFLLSFNEFTITFFVTGERQTFPVYMMGAFQAARDPTIYAMAGLTMIIAFTVLGAVLLPAGRAFAYREAKESHETGRGQPKA